MMRPMQKRVKMNVEVVIEARRKNKFKESSMQKRGMMSVEVVIEARRKNKFKESSMKFRWTSPPTLEEALFEGLFQSETSTMGCFRGIFFKTNKYFVCRVSVFFMRRTIST